MGKFMPVTYGQIESVHQMARAKGVSRTNWQSAEAEAPAHLYEFHIEKDGADATTLVVRTRETFFVSDHAEAMTNHATEFVVGPKEKVIVRVFACESMGVTRWTETDFFGQKGLEHVKKLGLVPCLFDDVFGIRTAHSEQKLDEWIRVVHPPISAGGYRRVFGVGHNSARGRCVTGRRLRGSYMLGAGALVALRVASLTSKLVA